MANLKLLLQAPFIVRFDMRFCTFWCMLVSFGTRAGTKVLVPFQDFNLIFLNWSSYCFIRKLSL